MISTPGPVLLSEGEIQHRIAEMAARISEDYRGRTITAIGILNGSFIFVGDLIRRLDPDIIVEIDFFRVSSYRSSTSSGEIRIRKDIDLPIEGKDVLLIEDIVDSGRTLVHVHNLLASRGPRSMRVATLLEKPGGHQYDAMLDYVGFQIPDRFVVGYGLDYAERYRNLPDIRTLDT